MAPACGSRKQSSDLPPSSSSPRQTIDGGCFGLIKEQAMLYCTQRKTRPALVSAGAGFRVFVLCACARIYCRTSCLVRQGCVGSYREMTTTDVPSFFVPHASPGTDESAYAELAKFCERAIPALSRRIYSITYVHDGEEWVATVGQALRGTRLRSRRIKGQRIEQSYSITDPAIVLAIFPGVPFVVVTNQGLIGNVGSRWANPFFTSEPQSITYFKQ